MKDIVSLAKKYNELIIGEDGYMVFWPREKSGALTAKNLQDLADYLDQVNASWDAIICGQMELFDEKS